MSKIPGVGKTVLQSFKPTFSIYKDKCALGFSAYHNPKGLVWSFANFEDRKTFDWTKRMMLMMTPLECGEIICNWEASTDFELRHGGRSSKVRDQLVSTPVKTLTWKANPEVKGGFIVSMTQIGVKLGTDSFNGAVEPRNVSVSISPAEAVLIKSIVTSVLPQLLGFQNESDNFLRDGNGVNTRNSIKSVPPVAPITNTEKSNTTVVEN